MKTYTNLTVAVLSPLDISSPEFGVAFFELLESNPLVVPTQIGNAEPISELYEGRTKGVLSWSDPVLWKNTNTKVNGSIWFGFGKRHSCIYLHLNPKNCDQVLLKRFLLESCKLFKADFGYIHLMTQQEMESSETPYMFSYAIDTGLTTNDLKNGVPNLCWATVFGPCYENYRNAIAKLKSIAIVDHDANSDLTYLQLTDNIKDIISDYAEFNAIRTEAKEMIGNQLFCSASNPIAGWTPSFQMR
jgi:hypothetical protein